MKAVVKSAAGYGHTALREVPEPEATGDLVKIKVAYTGICGTDFHTFRGTYPSAEPPLILGHEFAGIVSAVGPAVRRVRVGDRVTSETTFKTCGECPYCRTGDYNLCSRRRGLGTQEDGSMAEFVLSREESVHVLPDGVSLLSAALTEPLACAVHAAMEKTETRPGETVCVFGTGAIGLLLSWVLKAQGATVILAGRRENPPRFAVARGFGVDRTVGQQEEDLAAVVREMTGGVGADKAFECSGAVEAANRALELVKKKGTVIQMGVFPNALEPIRTDLILHREIAYAGSRSQKPTSWVKAIELMDSGKVRPEDIVSGIAPLDQWRPLFDEVMAGRGVKGVLQCNADIE